MWPGKDKQQITTLHFHLKRSRHRYNNIKTVLSCSGNIKMFYQASRFGISPIAAAGLTISLCGADNTTRFYSIKIYHPRKRLRKLLASEIMEKVYSPL